MTAESVIPDFANLSFYVELWSFTGFFLFFILCERFLNLLCVCVLLMLGRGDAIKTIAATQLVVALTNFWVALGQSVLGIIQRTISRSIPVIMWGVYLTLASILIFVIFEMNAGSIVYWSNVWAERLRPGLELIFFVPIRLLSDLFGVMLPIYNTYVYFGKMIYRLFVVDNSIRNARLIPTMAFAVTDLTTSSVVSVANYVSTLVPCEEPVTDACFAAGYRTLDFITPMGYLRALMLPVVELLKEMCLGASAPVDVVVYPLLDINFAKSIHLLANTVLYTFIQLPLVTYQRCKLYTTGTVTTSTPNVVYCLPDLEPIFNMAISGVRHFGVFIDNWLDVTSIIVQASIGMDVPSCDQFTTTLTAVDKDPDLFGGNETALVGIGGGLYAVTDGYNAQYFNHRTQRETILHVNAWPIAVEPAYGFAGVVYRNSGSEFDAASSSEKSTMMGCRCDDDASTQTMKITCAYAFLARSDYVAVAGDDLVSEVVFHTGTTAKYLTCSSAEISVKSLRWPAVRVSNSRSVNADVDLEALLEGAADAAVWVKPRCSSKITNPVCEPSFQGAACFPYCLALRPKGSGSGRLVLFNAPDWQQTVQLMGRDCLVGSVVSNLDNEEAVSASKARFWSGLFRSAIDIRTYTTTYWSEKADDNRTNGFVEERHDPQTSSELECTSSPKAVTVTGYDQLRAKYADNKYRSILLPEQPFALANDAVLTSVRNPDGNYVVRVERLFGEQYNEYTIVTVVREFPALPPASTPGLQRNTDRDALPTPYAFSTEGLRVSHPAVSTSSQIYFAVNPSLEMFQAFGEYCKKNISPMQLVVMSSYSQMRIWRMEPYVDCPHGNDGRDGCYFDKVRGVDVPGSFARWDFDYSVCTEKFTAMVTALEYIDERNIAVTVMKTTLKDFDFYELRVLPGATDTTYDIWYLDPSSDQPTLSARPHVGQGFASLGAGLLCPAMKRLPNVGSMVTESIAAVLHLVKLPLILVVALPGLVPIWVSGGKCSLVTGGHSLMQTCGVDVLSLDKFHDSVQVAVAHFWRSFSIIGDMVLNSGDERSANVLHGMAGMGARLTMDTLWGSRYLRKVTGTGNLPVQKVVGTVTRALPFNIVELQTAPVANSKWFFSLILGTIQRAVSIGANAGISQRQKAKKLAYSLLNQFYSQKRRFHEECVPEMLAICDSLAVMLQYTNPVAEFVRLQCQSTAVGAEAVYDMFLAVMVDTAATKSMCMDSVGNNLYEYMSEHLLPWAPPEMQPMLMSFVQDRVSPEDACTSMLETTKFKIKASMQPWFEYQYASSRALASAVDYLLKFAGDEDAGRCLEFESSPHTSVLIPSPVDYFRSCADTSLCRTQCAAEFETFQNLLALQDNPPVTKTSLKIAESKMFVSDNENMLYTPMNILAMTQLYDCSNVCGTELGGNKTQDQCVAIAGLSELDLKVQKYCIPGSLSTGIYLQEAESWEVLSERAWPKSVAKIYFADPGIGDAIVVLRDNDAHWHSDIPPNDLVTIHRRFDGVTDDNLLLDVQTLNLIDTDITFDIGVDTSSQQPHSINDMLVVSSASNAGSPFTWLLLRMTTVDLEAGSKQDISICLSLIDALKFRGAEGLKQYTERLMHTCPDLDNGMQIFEFISSFSYEAVSVPAVSGNTQYSYNTPSSANAGEMLLIPVRPTSKSDKYQKSKLCKVYFSASNTLRLSSIWMNDPITGLPDCYDVSSSFTGELGLVPTGLALDQQGAVILATNRLCMNGVISSTGLETKLVYTMLKATSQLTPDTWLSQIRVGFYNNPTSEKRNSIQVKFTSTFIQTCSMKSCLGCQTAELVTMCNVAQQCAIQKCVGSTVVQNRPLCNIGLTIKASMDLFLGSIHMAWLMITETLDVLTSGIISPTRSRDLTLEWVDDGFFGAVCAGKDIAASGSAIITSTIRELMVSTHKNLLGPVPLSYESTQLSRNFGSSMSILATAFNNLLYHILLVPLYMAIVIQKSIVCTGNAMFAATSAIGLDVSIGRSDLQAASGSLVGTCLTEKASAAVGSPDEDKASVGMSRMLAVMLSSTGKVYKMLENEQIIHMMDAAISYFIGIIVGMQDVAQVLDVENCQTPDFYMERAMTCTCGDKAVRIPQTARSDSKYWCTGTLLMSEADSSDNQDAVYVYNRYSFQQLLDSMGNLDRYMQCISTAAGQENLQRCKNMRPRLSFIEQQGVSTIAVLQKCRSNYQQKQWDVGAFVLYHPSLAFSKLKGPDSMFNTIKTIQSSSQQNPVANCLINANSQGLGNGACMQEHLSRLYTSQQTESHWIYDRDAGAGPATSVTTDACLVFSGPAEHSDPTVAGKFRACSSDYEDKGCQIQPFVWSAGSKNKVPVATPHLRGIETLQERINMASSIFKEAQESFQPILQKNINFDRKDLEAMIFSADGDSLHQIFDCVMLGPFSAVEFWTGLDSAGKLASETAESVLRVPRYARDASGLGLSRNMDLPCSSDKLNGDTRPPFTCGSETRRSMIKYFVRDYLNSESRGGSLISKLVRQYVFALLEAWSDTSKFQCECLDGGNRFECCERMDMTQADRTLLYDAHNASTPYDEIHANDVTRAVMEELKSYLQKIFTDAKSFTKYVSDGAKGQWDWSNDPDQAKEAMRGGVYHTHRPIVTYQEDEINWPFKDDKSIWDLCTGMMGQVIFTQPLTKTQNPVVPGAEAWTLDAIVKNMVPEFDPVMSAEFDDLPLTQDHASAVEKYVSMLLEDAYSSSPLYWHYAMRYAPSDSLVCLGNYTTNQAAAASKIAVTNNGILGNPNLLNSINALLQNVDHLGYAAYPLGHQGCFCGWYESSTSYSRCSPPAGSSLCQSVGLNASCSFEPGSDDELDVIVVALQAWNRSWPCAEMDFSDAWGFLPERNVATWLQKPPPASVSADALKILAGGRVGVRLGALNHLKQAAKEAGINPSTKLHQTIDLDTGTTIGLKKCLTSMINQVDKDKLVVQMVDDLFPVAQGITEPLPSAYCLRFGIEHARYKTARLFGAKAEQLVERQHAYETWKRRCNIQLSSIAMCKAHDIFHIVPATAKPYPQCPFVISDTYNVPPLGRMGSSGTRQNYYYYVTSGCVLYYNGKFYDPCASSTVSCASKTTITLAQATGPGSELAFQLPEMVHSDLFGLFPNGATAPSYTADAPRLTKAFVDNVLLQGSGAGNTPPGASWQTADGPAGNNNAKYCDMTVDWWPDDWTKPVGYHVSMPCHSSEANPRTFDNAFLLDRGDGSDTAFLYRMIYRHDHMRDKEAYQGLYGTGGFCRMGVYGAPLFETNIMRVCTREDPSSKFDAHVPVAPRSDNNPHLGQEKCAESQFDVPYDFIDVDAADASQLSVGSVPMWDGQWPTGSADVYPATHQQRLVRNTVPGAYDHYSDVCRDDEDSHLSCTTDSDCTALSGSTLGMVCKKGACVLTLATDNACYSHADCISQNKLCSGAGRCVDPLWQVENEHGSDIEFQLHSTDCTGPSARQYDTYGSSPWENVPDMLRLHGMCSYSNWYEYQKFVRGTDPDIKKQACLGCPPNRFDATNSVWPQTRRVANDLQMLWDTGLFRVLSHICDADYSRLAGRNGCSPDWQRGYTFAVSNHTNPQVSATGKYGQLMRTFDRKGEITVDNALWNKVSPSGEKKHLGFLNLDATSTITPDKLEKKDIRHCAEIPQCFKQVVTYNAHVISDRQVTRSTGATNLYRRDEQHSCGAWGYLDSTTVKCKIDPLAVPLYYVMCTNRDSLPGHCTRLINNGQLVSKCNALGAEYSALPDTENNKYGRETWRDNVNWLVWSLFNPPTASQLSSNVYVDTVECANHIWTTMKNQAASSSVTYMSDIAKYGERHGLYWFTLFGMVEVPFAWFYRCLMLPGIENKDSMPTTASASSVLRVNCPAWNAEWRSFDATELTGTNVLLLNGGVRYATLQSGKAGISAFVQNELNSLNNEKIPSFPIMCNTSFNINGWGTSGKDMLDCVTDFMQVTKSLVPPASLPTWSDIEILAPGAHDRCVVSERKELTHIVDSALCDGTAADRARANSLLRKKTDVEYVADIMVGNIQVDEFDFLSESVPPPRLASRYKPFTDTIPFDATVPDCVSGRKGTNVNMPTLHQILTSCCVLDGLCMVEYDGVSIPHGFTPDTPLMYDYTSPSGNSMKCLRRHPWSYVPNGLGNQDKKICEAGLSLFIDAMTKPYTALPEVVKQKWDLVQKQRDSTTKEDVERALVILASFGLGGIFQDGTKYVKSLKSTTETVQEYQKKNINFWLSNLDVWFALYPSLIWIAPKLLFEQLMPDLDTVLKYNLGHFVHKSISTMHLDGHRGCSFTPDLTIENEKYQKRAAMIELTLTDDRLTDIMDKTKMQDSSGGNVANHLYQTYMLITRHLLQKAQVSYSAIVEEVDFLKNIPTAWTGTSNAAQRNYLFDISEESRIDQQVLAKVFRCTESSDTVDYQSCDIGASTVLDTVRDSVKTHMRIDGPVIAPANRALLIAGLHAAHFLGLTTPAWSKHPRPLEELLVKKQLDNYENVCKESDIYNSVCILNSVLYQGPSLTVMNPYLGGYFNARDACDTEYTAGDQGETETEIMFCQEKRAGSTGVCTGERDQYYDGLNYQCENGRSVQYVNVGSEIPSNICKFRAPHAGGDVCTWPQGTLGGATGSPLSGADALYKDYAHSCSDPLLCGKGKGLFWQGGNIAYWSGPSAIKQEAGVPDTTLKMNADDIAGHHIVLKVTAGDGMYVDRAPLLHAYRDRASVTAAAAAAIVQASKNSNTTHGRRGWRRVYTYETIRDDVKAHENIAQSKSTAQRQWFCPLQRAMKWSAWSHDASRVKYGIIVPSPIRSSRLFGNLTEQRWAHPTQVAAFLPSGRIAPIYTSNGFCLCTDYTKCSVGRDHAQCGLAATISSTFDQAWRDVVQLDRPTLPCTQQLDWPYEGGTLRDGVRAPSHNMNANPCYVYDRLPKFQMRYMPTGTIKRDKQGRSSLDEAGSCHMGRAASPTKNSDRIKVMTELCSKIHSNSTHAVVRCSSDPLADIVLERKLAKPPEWLIENMANVRRKCRPTTQTEEEVPGMCSPPPLFYKTSTEKLPAGAEVSYGTPTRLCGARLLAADLKKIICGSHNNTAECTSLLQTEHWTVTQFLGRYFTSPQDLTKSTPMADANVPDLARSPQESANVTSGLPWSGKGWVFCDRADPTNCSGTMAWSDWRANKIDQCIDTFTVELSKKGQDSVGRMSLPVTICDLTDSMNELCIAAADAHRKLFRANCIAGGDCLSFDYFYSPGMYSVTNQRFVRSSVTDFYELHTPTEQAVCPQESLTDELKTQNEAQVQNCAANRMQLLIDTLEYLREIVQIGVQILLLTLDIVINLLKLILLPGDKSVVLTNLSKSFKELLDLIVDMLKTFADLLFDLIFGADNSFGRNMRDLVQKICEVVNIVYGWIKQAYCDFIEKVVLPFFQSLANVPFGIGTAIKKIKIQLEKDKAAFCDKEENLDCMIFPPVKQDAAQGATPLATRCWADYVTDAGDSDALSCHGADTCDSSPLSGAKPTVCDACPLQAGTLKYGCDTSTKKCTCNRIPTQHTPCVTNQECFLDSLDSTCRIVSDITTFSSFGNAPCKQCNADTMCLITPGASVGQCVCPLTNIRPQTCSQLGRTAQISYHGLCVTDLSSSARQSPIASLSWNEIVTISCALIPPSSSYCYDVRGKGRLVVGTDFLGSSGQQARRLLSAADEYMPLNVPQMQAFLLQHGDWNGTAEPCRSLIIANRSSVQGSGPAETSTTDRLALDSCTYWRAVANVAMRLKTNVGNISKTDTENAGLQDTFILSWQDFFENVARPTALRSLVFAPPSFWAFIVMHSDTVIAATKAVYTVMAKAIYLWGKNMDDAHSNTANEWNASISIKTKYQRKKGMFLDKNEWLPADFAFTTITAEQIRQTLAAIIVTTTKTMDAAQQATTMDASDLLKVIDRTCNVSDSGSCNGNMLNSANGTLLNSASGTLLNSANGTLLNSANGTLLNSASGTLLNSASGTLLNSASGTLLNSANGTLLRSRSLLQQQNDIAEKLGNVDISMFTTLQALTDAVQSGGGLSYRTTDLWTNGPFGWPPKYAYGDENLGLRCRVADTIVSESITVATIMKAYYLDAKYRDYAFLPPTISLQANLPKLNLSFDPVETYSTPLSQIPAWMAWVYETIGNIVLRDWLRISPSTIRDFTGSQDTKDRSSYLATSFNSLMNCDFEALSLCTARSHNLFSSLALSSAAYVLAGRMLSGLGLGSFNFLLLMGILPLAMWHAYGYSPVCAPMIPTCITTDIIDTVEYILPLRFQWPDAIQTSPNCTANGGGGECIRSCMPSPFSFSKWHRPISWVLCNLDTESCVEYQYLNNYIPGFQNSTLEIRDIVTMKQHPTINYVPEDVYTAFNYCFFVTLAQSVPWALLLWLIFIFATELLRLPIDLLAAVINLAAQFWSYTHISINSNSDI